MKIKKSFAFSIDAANRGAYDFCPGHMNKGQSMASDISVTVTQADCLDALKGRKKAFDLVFADPPFNIGQDYDEFDDELEADEFEKWCIRWIALAWKATRGVLALHGTDAMADIYWLAAKKLKMQRVGWVNWHFRFGQHNPCNWIDARCHCMIFARDPKGYTRNADAVLVESDRVKYGDSRINSSARGGKRMPGTVWGVPSDGPFWGRVTGNSKERVIGAPNQLPEVYLARLIKFYTNPGDSICDPFGGSGTTAVVAQALGRNCETFDVSASSTERIRERLKKGAVRI